MENNMKNLFVPYELAVKLKEKGFDEPCFATYAEHSKELSGLPLEDMEGKPCNALDYNWINSEIHVTNITAPLYQQVQDWFREKGLEVTCKKMWRYSNNHNPQDAFYQGSVCNFNIDRTSTDASDKFTLFITNKPYKSYYEPLQESIEEALNLIK